jgi:heptosyltransferase-2
MATPALRELRRVFAGSTITLVARSAVAELFRSEPFFDELMAHFERRKGVAAVTGFIREANRLRRRAFDLAVLFPNSFEAALMAKAARVRTVAGYALDKRGALLDVPLALDPDYKKNHQVEYYLNIVSKLEEHLTGVSKVDFRSLPGLTVSEKERAEARTILAGSLVNRDSRLAALSPGATNSRAKRWLPDRFARVADELSLRHGFEILLVGSTGDEQVARQIAGYMRRPAIVLAGRTTLGQLKGVLACSSLLISNDTGTAHVGSAIGVPTVVIFGPTEHFFTRPLSSAAAVVRGYAPCSPCMLRDCPIDHRCMTAVEASEVTSAAVSLIGG